MNDYKLVLLAVVLLFLMVELLWSFLAKRSVYNAKDILSNVSIFITNKLLKPIYLLWSGVLFSLVSTYAVFQIKTTLLTTLIAFLLVELVYYWYHRLSHEWPFLWSLHHTHHSSESFNLFVAPRLGVISKFISPFFYLPLILVGFSPLLLVTLLGVSLLYQFFLHTQMIPKLPKVEGLLFNTPSAHRVHHGKNKTYLDKNYGGMLIVYDRIFGTYTKESELPQYGVTTGSVGYNPLIILFQPFVSYLKRKIKT